MPSPSRSSAAAPGMKQCRPQRIRHLALQFSCPGAPRHCVAEETFRSDFLELVRLKIEDLALDARNLRFEPAAKRENAT
jgi:hypothetical protein